MGVTLEHSSMLAFQRSRGLPQGVFSDILANRYDILDGRDRLGGGGEELARKGGQPRRIR